MLSIDLSDIIEVTEAIGADNAQKYLDLGWKLLTVLNYSDGEDYGIFYSVGWLSTKGPVKHPEMGTKYFD